MKRILYIILAVCLIFSLAACGKRSEKEPPKNEKEAAEAFDDILKDAKNIDSEEEADKFVEDLTGWEIERDGDSMTVKTGIGEDGGEITINTGDVSWDADKVGGLPQPEGTTVYMGADMSTLFGEEYSYSYSLNGLTKDVYEEYSKLVKNKYPKIFFETTTENECSLMTSSESGDETILLTYIEDGMSIVQYMR